MLKRRFNVECVVWHPTVAADEIEQAIGLSRKIGWSAGEIYLARNQPKDRTYCRFDLGNHTQAQISLGLKMLKPFKALTGNSPFNDGKGLTTIYFKNVDEAAELYLSRAVLEVIRSLNASVVFR
jgi:hypothetical protein